MAYNSHSSPSSHIHRAHRQIVAVDPLAQELRGIAGQVVQQQQIVKLVLGQRQQVDRIAIVLPPHCLERAGAGRCVAGCTVCRRRRLLVEVRDGSGGVASKRSVAKATARGP